MKHVQIRNVPDRVHRTLKRRAADAGMSLSEYLLGELVKAANRPTLEELFERIHSRESAAPRTSSAKAVRLERDSRR